MAVIVTRNYVIQPAFEKAVTQLTEELGDWLKVHRGVTTSFHYNSSNQPPHHHSNRKQHTTGSRWENVLPSSLFHCTKVQATSVFASAKMAPFFLLFLFLFSFFFFPDFQPPRLSTPRIDVSTLLFYDPVTRAHRCTPVSYTHLTLPTICSV